MIGFAFGRCLNGFELDVRNSSYERWPGDFLELSGFTTVIDQRFSSTATPRFANFAAGGGREILAKSFQVDDGPSQDGRGGVGGRVGHWRSCRWRWAFAFCFLFEALPKGLFDFFFGGDYYRFFSWLK